MSYPHRIMYLRHVNQALLFAALIFGNTTAQSSLPEGFELDWSDVGQVVADKDGLCNTKASENAFVQIDPKLWREEFRVNCWWPVLEGRSRFFIKTYDWGSAPKALIYGTDGVSTPPVDVWVQGLHERDSSIPYSRSLTLYRITCASSTNRFAQIQFVAYNNEGHEVDEWSRPQTRLRAAIPGSKEESFTLAVCQ